MAQKKTFVGYAGVWKDPENHQLRFACGPDMEKVKASVTESDEGEMLPGTLVREAPKGIVTLRPLSR